MSEARSRASYLGGPDLATLMGQNRYQEGPFDVWLRKVEKAEIPDNAAMEWGRRLEPALAQAYSDRTGHPVAPLTPENAGSLNIVPQQTGEGWTIIHPDHPFLGGTPDFLCLDDPNLLLECKTAAEDQLYQTDKEGQPLWGTEGTDEVPTDYLVQCQQYMGLTGRRRADLAVFFIGPRRVFRVYELRFIPDLYARMVQVGLSFWQDYVIPEIPPPMALVPSDLVMEHLARKAHAGGSTLEIPPDLLRVALDLEEAGRRRQEMEEREAALKAQLLHAMAGLGAQKLQGQAHGARFSLAIQGGGEGKPVTAWSAIAHELARRLGLPSVPEELIHPNTRPGTPKSLYLMPYFNAVRNALKKSAHSPIPLSMKEIA